MPGVADSGCAALTTTGGRRPLPAWPWQGADIVRRVIIRDARPDEYPVVGALRVGAYQALGLLPEGSPYGETLRGFGFEGDCAVLVAVDPADGGILGTITLEPFGPDSELARDTTEADLRAFAVGPLAQGRGVGRLLLQAAIEAAAKRGVRRLRLCTRPPMEAAQHLYAAAGFTRTPELDWEPMPGVPLRAYELAL
jgi:ribosomal protein S18 acetylase RimI-like enzyme